MSKSKQNEIAVACGMNVAKNEVVKVGELPKTLKYPVITKATNPMSLDWKSNIFICHNGQELLEVYSKVSEKELLVQEYIYKKTEMCLDALVINHGKDVLIPIDSKYYRAYDNSYGHFMYFENFDMPELMKKVRKFFETTKYEGIFEMEFLVDQNDEYYFLECNWRNSTWSHFCTQCGFNMPYIWAKSMLEGKLATEELDIKPMPMNCLVEFDDFTHNVLRRKVGLWQWIKDVHSCKGFIYWNKIDKGPFFAMIKYYINRPFAKIFRR